MARDAQQQEVEVDDCFAGPNGVVSGTTLGPRWPELRLAAVVYLEHGFMASLPAALRPACPPQGGVARHSSWAKRVRSLAVVR
jgi:hypothetical protein